MQRNELTEMTTTMRNEDRDSLYELVTSDEFPVEYDLFTRNLNDLVDAELVIRNINESQDQVWYTGKPGLKYADFSSLDSPLKQQILLQFVENPATFFVLFNTQKGKSAIVQKKLMEWAREQRKQIVSILMLENDKTLGDQTIESLVARMKKEGVNVKLFPLVSTSKTSIDEILTYIDAYAGNPEEYPMPLITALTNPKQLEKVLRILKKVLNRNRQRHPNLHYAMIWDEADKTYPLVRDKNVQIEGMPTCIRQFTLDDTTALHGDGFVTATEGELLEGDYPECSGAYAFIPEMNEEDEQYYRAFHHPEAVIKCVKIIRKTKNNQSFLEDVFAKNKAHFMTPIVLKNGGMGFRKTIVNSSARGDEMTKLAKIMNGEKCHAMVFNQSGLTVYNCEASSSAPIRFKTKGRSFNELIFYAYKKCKLDTAPLFIVGRRKIDRGLGFHYAPRSHHGIVPKLMNFELGPLQTDGIEGLIWTDEFLGHVEIKETAVQKAGRLAGIVAQCPQYPNHMTWWTDEETASVVKRHYEIVDAANKLGGCHTMVQAIEHAKRENKQPIKTTNDECITVPIVIQITPDNFKNIRTRKGDRWKFDNLFECMEPSLRAELKRIGDKPVDHECPDPTKPGYEKKIIAYIEAANENKKIKAWASEISKNPTKDNYVIYLDQVEHRIIVSIYYGTKLNPTTTPAQTTPNPLNHIDGENQTSLPM